MKVQTFEAWAAPTSGTEHLDHTFVYCPEADKSFGCWNGGNRNASLAVRVMKETRAEGDLAYQVANCYRTPMHYAGKLRPDTAALGAYLINGVCHQSTNLFMYAMTHKKMTLQTINDGLRPMGLLLSYGAYGAHGAATPGGLTFPHWVIWVNTTFRPCNDKFRSKSDSESRIQAMIDRMTVKINPDRELNDDERRRLLIAEFSVCVEESLPTINAAMGFDTKSQPDSLDRLSGVHMDFLVEKDKLLTADFKKGQPGATEALAHKLNTLTIEFQKQIESTFGPQGYTQILGQEPGQYLDIADPRIAYESQK